MIAYLCRTTVADCNADVALLAICISFLDINLKIFKYPNISIS